MVQNRVQGYTGKDQMARNTPSCSTNPKEQEPWPLGPPSHEWLCWGRGIFSEAGRPQTMSRALRLVPRVTPASGREDFREEELWAAVSITMKTGGSVAWVEGRKLAENFWRALSTLSRRKGEGQEPQCRQHVSSHGHDATGEHAHGGEASQPGHSLPPELSCHFRKQMDGSVTARYTADHGCRGLSLPKLGQS